MTLTYRQKVAFARAQRLAKREIVRQKEVVLAQELNSLGKAVKLVSLTKYPNTRPNEPSVRVHMRIRVDGKLYSMSGYGDTLHDAMLEAIRYHRGVTDQIELPATE